MAEDELSVVYKSSFNYISVRKGVLTFEGTVKDGIPHFDADTYELMSAQGITTVMISEEAEKYLRSQKQKEEQQKG